MNWVRRTNISALHHAKPTWSWDELRVYYINIYIYMCIYIYIILQNSSIFTFQTVSSSKASFVTSGRSSLVIAFKALATAKKGAFLHKSVANPNTFTDHAFLTRSFLLSCCGSRLDVAVFPYFSFASDKKVQKPSPWNWPRKVVWFLLLLFVANPVRTAKLKSSDRLQQQHHASSFPCQATFAPKRKTKWRGINLIRQFHIIQQAEMLPRLHVE